MVKRGHKTAHIVLIFIQANPPIIRSSLKPQKQGDDGERIAGIICSLLLNRSPSVWRRNRKCGNKEEETDSRDRLKKVLRLPSQTGLIQESLLPQSHSQRQDATVK